VVSGPGRREVGIALDPDEESFELLMQSTEVDEEMLEQHGRHSIRCHSGVDELCDRSCDRRRSSLARSHGENGGEIVSLQESRG
jgi:hypothetical protein